MKTPTPPFFVPSVLATSTIFPLAIFTCVSVLVTACLLEFASSPTTCLL